MALLRHLPTAHAFAACSFSLASLVAVAMGCGVTPADGNAGGSGGSPSASSGGSSATGGQVGSGGAVASGGAQSGDTGGSGGSEEEGGYGGGSGGGNALPETCEDGKVVSAPDGCNTCTCLNDDWLCTLIACNDPDEKGCGGWLGDTCSKDEFCAYEEGQWCGAADASAVCKPRPEGCTLEYAPVCGCDGETYSNSCLAASAGTGVYEAGSCDEQDP